MGKGWSYEITTLADHFYLPIFKLSRMMESLTSLQITSTDLKGRESEIPFPVNQSTNLDAASNDIVV